MAGMPKLSRWKLALRVNCSMFVSKLFDLRVSINFNHASVDIVEAMAYIVLIEDSAEISALVSSELRSAAHEVATADDGSVGLSLIHCRRPDLVILDIVLPGISGLEILRRLREVDVDVPVIMLTARDNECDRVAGLELGADDYVVKPFSLRELAARVSAILRRQRYALRGHASVNRSGKEPGVIAVLDCEVELAVPTVRVAGQARTLSRREFDLLLVLMRHPDRALTREWLLEQIWGPDYSGDDRVVDGCMVRLKERLGRSSAIARSLESVRGIGYRLNRKKA